MTEYREALEALTGIEGYCTDHFELPQVQYETAIFIRDHEKTIKRALKLAEKISQEPSQGMIKEGHDLLMKIDTVADIFKAMVAKLIEEVG